MSDKKTVFITGTSSGIGRTAAELLQSRGWRVFAGARKPEDLDSLREGGFETVDIDLADSDSISRAVEGLKASAGGGLDALVNNAGYGQPGALEDLDRDAMRRQFEVNVFGLLELTNALLPDMIRRGEGRIVHVSSVVGRVAIPLMGIYSASKFAVEAIADVQRVELKGTGVRVVLVEPGPITTRFSKNAELSAQSGLRVEGSRFKALYDSELEAGKGERDPRPFSLPPEAAAAKIAKALAARRPAARYKVTLPAHFGAVMSRVAPAALLDGILAGRLR